ncbi:hypothetical protein AAFF_G00206280 [Aldrovandia affinis]|uniref:Uncharacterized protein n=1 Tax=Aldrovandia affinis TaxID=143900 RepID=A0AAD7W5N6_9TELE|nr:hypothetical protein AAFF_G00206280 [Aldrovandia affinis]
MLRSELVGGARQQCGRGREWSEPARPRQKRLFGVMGIMGSITQHNSKSGLRGVHDRSSQRRALAQTKRTALCSLSPS